MPDYYDDGSMFTVVNEPNEGGRFERVVVRQSKISACPPNQIMDLFILVDTTSGISDNFKFSFLRHYRRP